MRTIIYSVINKNTNERVFTRPSLYKCEEFLKTLPNPDDYRIGYKWMSF